LLLVGYFLFEGLGFLFLNGPALEDRQSKAPLLAGMVSAVLLFLVSFSLVLSRLGRQRIKRSLTFSFSQPSFAFLIEHANGVRLDGLSVYIWAGHISFGLLESAFMDNILVNCFFRYFFSSCFASMIRIRCIVWVSRSLKVLSLFSASSINGRSRDASRMARSFHYYIYATDSLICKGVEHYFSRVKAGCWGDLGKVIPTPDPPCKQYRWMNR